MEDYPRTIAAIATPPGRGGVGIVRVSGLAAASVAKQIVGGLPPARRAVQREFRGEDGRPIDRGLALWFPAPGSYTGEDVLELHGHGGPIVLDLVLSRVLALGAHMARPGEFSERAFLNGKMDLSQAEAVADLIEASTEAAARAAARTLAGAFSQRVHDLVDTLTELRAHVEGSLDFPDEEDVGAISLEALECRLEDLAVRHAQTISEATQGAVLTEGFAVAIVGAPNAGKSSLLNRLCAREIAIVTPVPGTTRDTVRETLNIDGVPIHLVDTAGLRSTSDPVERVGIERARVAAREADLVLWVIDDSTEGGADVSALSDFDLCLGQGSDGTGSRLIRVRNKIDLSGAPSGREEDATHQVTTVAVSAISGAGIDDLKRAVLKAAGISTSPEGLFAVRRRHLEVLARSSEAIERAISTVRVQRAIELAADDLRLAQQALGEITGEFTNDDLLGTIFSAFCIGK